jgi:Type II secretion system (T2SS), protein G
MVFAPRAFPAGMKSVRKGETAVKTRRMFVGISLMGILVFLGVGVLGVSSVFSPCYGPDRQIKAQARIQSMTSHIQRYMMKGGGAYPKDLDALVPNIMQSIPKDPWGNPYQYLRPGKHNPTRFDLWSTGVDVRDVRDDIGNWSPAQE